MKAFLLLTLLLASTMAIKVTQDQEGPLDGEEGEFGPSDFEDYETDVCEFS